MEDSIVKKPKILCLHGGNSSGTHLKEKLQVWHPYVLQKLDLVFIDAPFPNKPDDADHTTSFCWYPVEDTGDQYDKDFEESITYIEDSMLKLGPFDGILGFSQGALVAASLPGMQAHGVALTKVEDIKFVVVISGGKLGGSKFAAPKLAENAFSSPIDIPSLHCFGENDLAKLTAIELLGSFVDPFVIYHSGGHEVPKLDEDGLKVFLSFLDKIGVSLSAQRIRSLM